MYEKELSFEEIYPFVRHVHFSGIGSFHYMKFLKSLDCRIFYIYDGKGYYMVDGQKQTVSKGNLLFWQPGTEYRIYSDPSFHLVIIGINFDFTHDNKTLDYPVSPVESKKFDKEKIIERVYFTDTDIFNKPVFLKDFRAYEHVLVEINSEFKMKKKFYSQKISGLLLSILAGIARHVSIPTASNNPERSSIDNVLNYIHEHYNEQISNKEIGKMFSFHPNYINKLMVLHTGTSLHKYLMNYRISMAINLMQTTGKSISEIAYSVGYKDVNYFSKAFKNKMGESPKQFRSRNMGLF